MKNTVVYAKAKRYEQPPRKVRLVVDLVRGMNAQEALRILNNVNKKSAKIISKLINNAVSCAVVNNGMSRDKLYICEARVDESDKRVRPFYRARGRLNYKIKRLSNIIIGVCEKDVSVVKTKKLNMRSQVKTNKFIGKNGTQSYA